MRTALLRLAVLAACAALPMAVLAQVAVPIPVSQGEATSVLASPDGAVTLAGFVFSDGDFDPGPGEALGRGGFIARYESDGALRWLWAEGTGTRDAQIFGATNRPEDGIAAAAWLNGTLDLDPGPGETTVSGSQGLLVLALDAAGALDWSIVVDGSARIFAQGIGTDASGNVYVTGWIQQGSADFDPGPGVTQLSSSGFDLFVASYSASGAFRWAFNVGSSGTAQVRGYALAVDATGVLVGGQFVNTHDFDPGPGEAELSSRGGADGFVARYALDGTFEWATQFGDTGTDITLGLGATGDGGALVAGQVETDARNNERAAYMARLLPNGTAAWAHTIPGGRGDQVQARAAAVVGDQAVFGGRYGADFDADAGPGERILLLPAGGGLGATGYLASYDVGTGGLVEAARIGEVTPAVVSAVAAGTQPDAPVLIGGGFSDRVTFPDSQSLTVSPASLQPLYAAGFVFGPRPPLSLTVEEQIGVTDEVSILRALALLVEEQIGVTDAVSLLEALQLLVEEQIGVTDDVSFLEALTLLIEERIGITDEAIVLRALALLIEERIGVTDEASLLQAIRLLVQEQIGVTDDADLLRALQLLVEERIGTTDGAGLDSDAFAFASLFTGVDGRFTFGETGMTLDLVGEGMGEITVLRLYDAAQVTARRHSPLDDLWLVSVEETLTLSPETTVRLSLDGIEGAVDLSTLSVTFRASDTDAPVTLPTTVDGNAVVASGLTGSGEVRLIARMVSQAADTPSAFALHPPFPNPTASRATVRIDLPAAADVQVVLFDPLGRRVAVLAEGRRPAGTHDVAVPDGLGTGTYVVRAVAGADAAVRRLVVTR